MSIDLTGIASSVIAGVFTILGIVVPMIINSRMKDKQAAAVLSSAVSNALGAIQQAAQKGLAPTPIPGVPASLAAGVAYVQRHAGDEADRFNLTPALIADKIQAKVGLHELAVAAAQPPMSAIVLPRTA